MIINNDYVDTRAAVIHIICVSSSTCRNGSVAVVSGSL